MSWSFSLGRVFGSDVRIHVTFFLLLAWIAYSDYRLGGVSAAVEGISFILALFACVVAHEFGHVLAARRYGIRTAYIILLPIGGLARLERMPVKASQEIIVALAGPAVNVAIALLCILMTGSRFELQTLERFSDPALDFVSRLAAVNLLLVIFNLIPAYPMDGGRVLRALLTLVLSRDRASAIAARIGQAFALVFGVIGLIAGDPLLLCVAVFLFLAAQPRKSTRRQRIPKKKPTAAGETSGPSQSV
jgi:Zn-dependent protease